MRVHDPILDWFLDSNSFDNEQVYGIDFMCYDMSIGSCISCIINIKMGRLYNR